MNDTDGSFLFERNLFLSAIASNVFTLVRAHPEINDDNVVIFDGAKANNDTPLPFSA